MLKVLATLLISLALVSPVHAALTFASGHFTVHVGTGDQTITDAACANPRVVILWHNRSTADATFSAHSGFGFGASVDAGTDQHMQMTFFNTDNVATTDSQDAKTITTSIQNQANVSPGFNVVAVVSAFNSNGFTVDYSVQDGANRNIIHYICLGGADITNAFLGEFTGPATAIEQGFTGVGFQGNLGLFWGIDAATPGTVNSSDWEFFLGACKSSTERAVMAAWGNDGDVNAVHSESYITDANCLAIPNASNERIENLADFVSWDPDGFTLDYSLATHASVVFFGLILQGTFQSDIAVQARPTSTGSVGYNNPNFTPKGILLGGTFATATATETAQAHLSIGAYDGTTNTGQWNGDNDADTIDANQYSSASNVYTQATNPSTVAAQAAATALTSTGYTLNWTTADANARLFMGVALGDAASSRRPVGPMVFQ